MAQRKLARSLYRSLFRWSRQACVRDAPLAMNPINYGVSSSLLEKVDFGREAVVTSAQDFRNLTRSSFRLEKSESEVNAALDSLLMNLPRLFTESEMISQRTAKRMSSSSPENLALRTFRVGEVVLHKESKTRHVVTGWEIDNGVQHIHTLCDHLDQQNSALSKIEGKSGEDAVQASSSMSSTPDNANSNGAVSHTEFEHVHNKVLMRILNESVNNFFDGYDTVLERYIPNAHLQYSFPADYSLSDIAEAAFKSKISTHLQLDTYEGGVDGYIAEVEEANRRSRTRDEKEIFYVVKSLRRLLHEVNGQLDEIMAFYEVDPNASLSEETTAKVMSAEEATTHILDSMLEMLSKLKGLERELGNLIVDPEVVSSPSKSLSGNRIIYESVSTLSSILIEAEKMLDFRWQSRGHIHFEQEMQQRLDFAIAKANGEVEGEEMPALEPTHAPPVFRIGEVVKTKRFGWRGVIISVHLRADAPDAGNWEGVSDTPSGAAQPFYRVLPDESDMTEGTSILARLIAEENLELHDTSSQGMISTS
ncbi:YccV family DNA-binding protein, partial [Candidatus Poseidonia alphae]|nr:YccV family DNA-binding protein [Candidatus Poseidonia alphae]